jgi:hypothetical protein
VRWLGLRLRRWRPLVLFFQSLAQLTVRLFGKWSGWADGVNDCPLKAQGPLKGVRIAGMLLEVGENRFGLIGQNRVRVNAAYRCHFLYDRIPPRFARIFMPELTQSKDELRARRRTGTRLAAAL